MASSVPPASRASGELQEIKGSTLAEQYPTLYRDLRHITENVPTVVLDEEFKDYAAYRNSIVRKLGDRSMEERKERFGLALGVTVANLFGRERQLKRKEDKAEQRSGTVERTAMTEPQLLRAATEAARGILALMPDFDALLGDLGDATQDDGAGAAAD